MGNFKKRDEKGNSYLIQAKNLCLICFKECTSESVGRAKLLCRILERYFGVNFVVPELSLDLQQSGVPTNPKSSRSNVHFLICENCSALSGKIGHLFKKLELVQMKLNACGQNLCDIMNSAEKVSSRIEMFDKRMASFKAKADGKVKIIQKVRREIVKKCNNKIERTLTNSMLPRAKIVIEKMPVPSDDYTDNFPPLVNVQQSQDLPEPDENYHSALVGCTMSFCVVILLSFLNVDQPVKAEDKANMDIMLSSSNTVVAVDDMEDIKSAKRSENTSAFQILMTYRKRKISKQEYNENEPPAIKRLLCNPTNSLSGESTDSISEEDVNREEWRIAEMERKQGNETPKGIEHSSMITVDEAVNAVNAIPMVYQSVAKTKTLRVKAKSDPHTHTPPITKREFPTWSNSDHKMECEEENVLPQMKEENVLPQMKEENVLPQMKEENVLPQMKEENVLPQMKEENVHDPFAIDVKQVNEQENSSTSTALSLVPVNNPLTSNNTTTQLIYKCHVCLERFNSRAKIEKHRVVVHNFTNYVQCPSCFQMLPSYFQLELHRRDQPECRLDAPRKQMELCDIARPYFPFEIIINGRHFCPFEDCCEVFEDVNNLIVHVKVHGKFQCRFGCSQVFGKGHELAVHELTFHRCGIVNAQKNLFHCPRCDFISKRRDEYIPHFMHEHLNIITQ